METPTVRLRLFQARSKKEVTERNVGGLVVVARVPAGAFVRGPRENRVAEAGAEILFQVRRCHLSTGSMDQVVFSIEVIQPPEFDITDDLRFYGDVLIEPDGAGVVDPYGMSGPPRFRLAVASGLQSARGMPMFLPVRWITHVVRANKGIDLVPVPRWTADDDDAPTDPPDGLRVAPGT